MTQEKDNGNGKIATIRALAREWGALLLVGAFGYYMLAIHTEDTRYAAEVIEKNTAAVNELTSSVKTWTTLMDIRNRGTINQSSVPQNATTN